MSIEWLVTNFLAGFLLPPLNGLMLIMLGWLALHRHRKLGQTLLGMGLLLLWLLAMPAVGGYLLRTLEGEPLDLALAGRAQAIVVLGGGRYHRAPEYGEDTVTTDTLPRLRYAARLYRQTRLPLLVAGGKPDGEGLSEGEAMRRILVTELGVPVRWVEETSINTRENAVHSAAILRQEGISRILLVTHSWHMPRAQNAFERSGIAVYPAPTLFDRSPPSLIDFMPHAQGISDSRRALHEWIGIVWYRLRG